MKTLRVIILSISLVLFPTQAFADNASIEGFADISYQNPIKLKATGCQNLQFSYMTNDSLARENTVFLMQLVHKSKKIVYGGAAWFSTLTSSGPDPLPSMPRIGKLKMKVCRNAWASSPEIKGISYQGVNPGQYRIYFVGGYVDPVTGAKTGDKVEIFRTVNLI